MICFAVSLVLGLLSRNFLGVFFTGGNRPLGIIETVLVSLVAGLFLNAVVANMLPLEWRVANRIELESLVDANSTTGKLFLGSGRIGPAAYYFYNKKVGNGFRPDEMEITEDVTSYEDSEDPHIVTYQAYPQRRFVPWIVISQDLGTFKSDRVKFHIPKGTLKRKFFLH